MKNHKKKLIDMLCIISLLSLSLIPIESNAIDDTISTPYDVISNNSKVDVSTFGTVYEKNINTIVKAELNEDSTVIYFVDGTSYTLPQCDDLIASKPIPIDEPQLRYIDENGKEYYTDECYYLVGYAVSYFHSEYKGNVSGTYTFLDEVTLPDGSVLNTSHYSDVQAVYNLDGEYMGYRTRIGESNFSDILVSTTIIGDSTQSPVLGDSTQKVNLNETPTGIRGDINYDGEVNAVDLLLLKKYILQIITW